LDSIDASLYFSTALCGKLLSSEQKDEVCDPSKAGHGTRDDAQETKACHINISTGKLINKKEMKQWIIM
jgi:hypothetical protein